MRRGNYESASTDDDHVLSCYVPNPDYPDFGCKTETVTHGITAKSCNCHGIKYSADAAPYKARRGKLYVTCDQVPRQGVTTGRERLAGSGIGTLYIGGAKYKLHCVWRRKGGKMECINPGEYELQERPDDNGQVSADFY